MKKCDFRRCYFYSIIYPGRKWSTKAQKWWSQKSSGVCRWW